MFCGPVDQIRAGPTVLRMQSSSQSSSKGKVYTKSNGQLN